MRTQVIPLLTDGKAPVSCRDRCRLEAVLPRTGLLAAGTAAVVVAAAAAAAAAVVDCIVHTKGDIQCLDCSRSKTDCEVECLSAGSLYQSRL